LDAIPRKVKVILAIATAAALGGLAAVGVAGAQGPYQPTTTTTTTTTTLPADDERLKLKLGGTAGTQPLKSSVAIEVAGRLTPTRQSNQIFIAGYGRMAIKVSPGGRGRKCRDEPKGKDERFKLGNDFATINSGESVTLKLKIPKSARREAQERLVCKDTKAKAVVRIRANDDFGNKKTRDRTVKIRPD
jgi:hypothetical protein